MQSRQYWAVSRWPVTTAASHAAGHDVREGHPPTTILDTRKRDTGLPDGEDRIPLRSLILCDGQCDGRTDLL